MARRARPLRQLCDGTGISLGRLDLVMVLVQLGSAHSVSAPASVAVRRRYSQYCSRCPCAVVPADLVPAARTRFAPSASGAARPCSSSSTSLGGRSMPRGSQRGRTGSRSSRAHGCPSGPGRRSQPSLRSFACSAAGCASWIVRILSRVRASTRAHVQSCGCAHARAHAEAHASEQSTVCASRAPACARAACARAV